MYELNPYKKFKNAYLDLPDRMLLYRTAYPLQYINGAVEHNKAGVSLNARMYDLNFAEYNFDTLEGLKQEHFNVWREMMFYEYIRNNVIKPMESPNFVLMYGYFISMNSGIPFEKIRTTKSQNDQQRRHIRDTIDESFLKNKHINQVVKRIYLTNFELDPSGANLRERFATILNVAHNPSKKLTVEELEGAREYVETRLEILTDENIKYQDHLLGQKILNALEDKMGTENNPNKKYKRDRQGAITHNKVVVQNDDLEPTKRERQIKILETVKKATMTHSCNKCLVALTESPSYDLLRWCTASVAKKGLVYDMKRSGYHSPLTWMSILFQVCHVFAVLQKHQIMITNMGLDNFFIKESTEKHKPAWLYKVNGVEYYVPNNGYLVMFDSKYRDGKIDPSNLTPSIEHIKMHGNIFGGEYDTSNIIKSALSEFNQHESDEYIYSQFRSLLNINEFGKEFVKKGGIIPDEVKTIINNINEDGRVQIIDYFHTYFSDFLNFKTGTIIPDNDAVLEFSMTSQFQIGELAALEERCDQYRYVIYKNNISHDPYRCTILYRDDKKHVFEKEIGVNSLRKISKRHKSEQRSDGKVNHNSEVYSLRSNE